MRTHARYNVNLAINLRQFAGLSFPESVKAASDHRIVAASLEPTTVDITRDVVEQDHINNDESMRQRWHDWFSAIRLYQTAMVNQFATLN